MDLKTNARCFAAQAIRVSLLKSANNSCKRKRNVGKTTSTRVFFFVIATSSLLFQLNEANEQQLEDSWQQPPVPSIQTSQPKQEVSTLTIGKIFDSTAPSASQTTAAAEALASSPMARSLARLPLAEDDGFIMQTNETSTQPVLPEAGATSRPTTQDETLSPTSTPLLDENDSQRIAIDANRQQFVTHDQLLREPPVAQSRGLPKVSSFLSGKSRAARLCKTPCKRRSFLRTPHLHNVEVFELAAASFCEWQRSLQSKDRENLPSSKRCTHNSASGRASSRASI